MRLGEILIGAGFLQKEGLQQALAVQTNQPGRLGSHAQRLGLASADEIAQALAKQHHVMPALIRHLVNHDPTVLSLVSAKTSADHGVLPIAYAGTDSSRLVLCFRDPKNQTLIRKLEDLLNIEVVVCVASEMTMQVYWGHYYNSLPTEPSDADDVDVDLGDLTGDGGSGTPSPFVLVDLDHEDVEKIDPGFFLHDLGAISALQQAVSAAEDRAKRKHTTFSVTDVSDVLETIGIASDRPAVMVSLMAFLEQRFAAAVLFTVKDGLAMGLQGFGGHLDDPETVLALMLPIDAGIIGQAYTSGQLWCGAPADHHTTAQERFLKLFAIEAALQEVAVAPIVVGKRIIAFLYVHGARGEPLDVVSVDELSKVVSATEAAFSRIIQQSRQKHSHP